MRFVSPEEIISTNSLKVDVWTGSSKWKKARVLEHYLD